MAAPVHPVPTDDSTLDVALLAEVPLLTGLPAATLHALAAAGRRLTVHAGEPVVVEGEPGDSAFVVRSGRVEVSAGGRVLGWFGRGYVFGEIALLTGQLRTATVRARRDAELLVLARADVDRLLTTETAFAAAVARRLARWATEDRTPDRGPVAASVLALVPLHAAVRPEQVARLGHLLTAELGRTGPAFRLDGDGDPEGWADRVERAEDAGRVVVLVADRPDGAWAEFCRRQADRVLGVADPSAGGPAGASLPRAGNLVALHTRGLAAWLAALMPTAHHLVDPAAPEPDLSRLARRVRGRALGVVLSGGGARGLAHIGVVDVLRRAGLVVDRVGGTSMGAVVAGLVATGVDTEAVLAVTRRELVSRNVFGDFTWPRYALARGTRVDAALARAFGDARVEDQRCTLFTVSVDMLAAETVVHRTGRIADAVALSVRLPGVVPPRRVGERMHVDGGVLDNLPIGVMAADGEGPVVAVDVAPPFHGLPGVRRGELPGIVDTIARSMTLAGARATDADRGLAHTVIVPQLDDVAILDFGRADAIIAAGRRAAHDALPGLADLRPGGDPSGR
jgi:NTE family protein